jgi:hypothetical protein
MLGCAKCKKTYEASLENFPPKDDPLLLEFAQIYLMLYSEDTYNQKQVKDYFERYK